MKMRALTPDPARLILTVALVLAFGSRSPAAPPPGDTRDPATRAYSAAAWRPETGNNAADTVLGDVMDKGWVDASEDLFKKHLSAGQGFTLIDKVAASELWSAAGSITGGDTEGAIINLTKYGVALGAGALLGTGWAAVAAGAVVKVGIDALVDYMTPVANATRDFTNRMAAACQDQRDQLEKQFNKYYANENLIRDKFYLGEIGAAERDRLLAANQRAMNNCNRLLTTLEHQNERLRDHQQAISEKVDDMLDAQGDFQVAVKQLAEWDKAHPGWEHGSISQEARDRRDREREALRQAVKETGDKYRDLANAVDRAAKKFGEVMDDNLPAIRDARTELKNNPEDIVNSARETELAKKDEPAPVTTAAAGSTKGQPQPAPAATPTGSQGEVAAGPFDDEMEAFIKGLRGKSKAQLQDELAGLERTISRGRFNQDDPTARQVLEYKKCVLAFVCGDESYRPNAEPWFKKFKIDEKTLLAAAPSTGGGGAAATSQTSARGTSTPTTPATATDAPAGSATGASSATATAGASAAGAAAGASQAGKQTGAKSAVSPWNHEDEMAKLYLGRGEVYNSGKYADCKTVADVKKVQVAAEKAARLQYYVDTGSDATATADTAGGSSASTAASDQARTAARDAARAAVKETVKDTVKSTVKDTVKATVKDTTKSTVKDSTRNTTKDTTRSTTRSTCSGPCRP